MIDDSAGTDPDIHALDDFDDVEVLRPPFNLGHQRAIVYGLRHIVAELDDGDVVVTMDSDGEDQPCDVPRLLRALDADTVALALAQRTKRSEPLRFRVMYVVFRIMFRVLTGTTIRSGNFAAQRGDSLAVTIQHPSFDLCYSSTLLALRRPTATVPCARGHRFAGSSRMNTYALMAHGVRMLLPFSERIAVRMMFVAATSALTLLVFLVVDGDGSARRPSRYGRLERTGRRLDRVRRELHGIRGAVLRIRPVVGHRHEGHRHDGAIARIMTSTDVEQEPEVDAVVIDADGPRAMGSCARRRCRGRADRGSGRSFAAPGVVPDRRQRTALSPCRRRLHRTPSTARFVDICVAVGR